MSEARKDLELALEPVDDVQNHPSTPPPLDQSPEHNRTLQSADAAREEAKLLRRLQMMMNMVMGVIAQDNTLSYDEAAAMVADARTAALAMFPGKELAYDLIWRPRFQRLMRERFRLM